MQGCARILIVNDNPHLRRATSRLLTSAGYAVVEAKTAAAGLDLATEQRPDLVLLDVTLPDMDGLELCRRIKAEPALASSFVVLISSLKTGPDNRAEGRESGADGYITRPISNRELLARVEAMLRIREAEGAIQRLTHELGERVKELDCAYGISALVERPGIALAEILQGTTDLLPPAWQYPAITGARVTLHGQEFTTKRFNDTAACRQTADIHVQGQRSGIVEVCYLERRPDCDEGPFLKEERRLINTIAERLGRVVERVTAEEVLQETSRLLETILEHTHVLVAYLDPQFNFIRVNRAYAQADERDPSFFPGKNHFDLFPNAENEAIFRRVVETGEPYFTYAKPFEYAEHPERGTTHWDWSLVPIKDPNGKVTGLVLTIANVTDRVRAEEALRDSEEKFRSIVEQSNDAIILTDGAGNVIEWNASAERITGLQSDEVIGRPLWDVQSRILPQERRTPDAHNEVKGMLRQLFSAQVSAWSSELRENEIQRPDGTRAAVQASVFPIQTAMGFLAGSIVRDVTEKKKMEETLRRERDFIAAVLDTEGALVVVLDRQGQIVRFNRACERLTGYAFHEVEGQRLWDLFLVPEEMEPVKAVFEETQAGQFPNTYENYWRTRNGDLRRIAWCNTALLDADGTVEYIIGTGIDISERVRAEEALSTLLEISRRMALNPQLEPLLDLILDQLKTVVDYDDASIFKLEDQDLLTLAHRGTTPQEQMLGQRFSLEYAPFGRDIILNQDTVIIADVRGDAPLAQDFRRVTGEQFERLYGQVRSWMGVPLAIKDRVMGILTLKHGEPDHYTSSQADLVRGFADQAAVAIENTRLYEQAQVLAALEERQRLARDLHDAVSQTLFSASLAAEVLPRLWERKPDEARRCLSEVQMLTRGALADMRTLLLELRPAGLLEVGLDDLLGQLVEAASSRARVPIDLTVEGQCALPPEVQVNLYRIIQEALSNIVKHAGATRGTVSLHCEPTQLAGGEEWTRMLKLSVKDDGRGFDARNIPPDRLGLCIMRERAESIGAQLEIESQPGQGTQVAVLWTGDN